MKADILEIVTVTVRHTYSLWISMLLFFINIFKLKIMSKTPAYYQSLEDRNYQQVLDKRISEHSCTRAEAAWNWERYSNHTRPNKYND